MLQQELLLQWREVEAPRGLFDRGRVLARLLAEPAHRAAEGLAVGQEAVAAHGVPGIRAQKFARRLESSYMRARKPWIAGSASAAVSRRCSSINRAMSRIERLPSIIAIMKA